MAFRLNLGVLSVTIGADTAPLKRAEKEVQGSTNRMGSSFKKLGPIIAGAISVEAVRRTVMLADRMNMLDASLRAVAKNEKEFAKLRSGIRGIADETGNSIEEITRLTQGVVIASETIGATTEQTLQLTENLSKLGAIGGSSTEAMSNSMRQFSQAMAGGVVRAEEMNSIIENTPLIAKAIADSMGITVGELRKAVIEGKVLSEDVFKALLAQTDDINKKFGEMPLTIDRASGMLSNAFASAVQDLANGEEITQSIAETMAELADFIGEDLVPIIDGIVDGFSEMGMLLDAVTQDSQEAVNQTFNWAQSLALVKAGFMFVVEAIKNLPVNIRAVFTIIIGEADQLATNISAFFQTAWVNISTSFKNLMTSAIGAVKASFFEFIAAVGDKFASLLDFFGADSLAEKLRSNTDVMKTIAEDLTAHTQEQVALRTEISNQEIETINATRDAAVSASQAAIDAELAYTEALKAQVAERTKQHAAERKARRNKSKGVVEDNKVETKSNDEAAQKNVLTLEKQAQSVESLRQSGLVSDKAAAAAQIGISAAKAIAKTSELGFPQAIPFIAQALATIATARSQLAGAGRQFGGVVSPGRMHPINESGEPEVLQQGSRQYLLPGNKSGMVTPMARAGGGGSSGGLTVIVNNNGDPVEVESAQFVTSDQLEISLRRSEDRAVQRVNSSLASGRGETFNSLRQGADVGRRTQ